MSNDEAERFRKQAEERYQQAEKAVPLDKEAWLKVAAEWIKLAQANDKRGGKNLN